MASFENSNVKKKLRLVIISITKQLQGQKRKAAVEYSKVHNIITWKIFESKEVYVFKKPKAQIHHILQSKEFCAYVMRKLGFTLWEFLSICFRSFGCSLFSTLEVWKGSKKWIQISVYFYIIKPKEPPNQRLLFLNADSKHFLGIGFTYYQLKMCLKLLLDCAFFHLKVFSLDLVKYTYITDTLEPSLSKLS